MKLLALDTSTLCCSVALFDGDALVGASEEGAIQGHASALAATVSGVLDDARIDLRSVDAVAVGSGPGSFTGLRIGYAWAKAVCLALNAPLYVVPSIESFTFHPDRASGASALIAAMDARKGQVYARAWSIRHGREWIPLGAYPTDEFLRRLIDIPDDERAHYVGDAWDRVDALRAVPPAGPPHVRTPSARSFRAWVAEIGDRSVDAASAEPRYVRPPDAVLPAREQHPPNLAISRPDAPLRRVPRFHAD
jgi:tRNA threonylcarbamoyladenosine biosynthesis protein TsaB